LRDSNTFPHLSQTLADQLRQAYNSGSPRGNGVYFDGPYTTHGNGGLSARLYTPSQWAGGSSMSHTDDQTYPAGNIKSLMNHATATAESVHQLGPVELGILADSGWAGFICAAKLGSLNNNFPHDGGTLTLSITLPSFCGWAVTNNSSFLTVSGASSGTGSGTVTFTVAVNSGAPRTGNVTINGIPYTVSQSNTGNVAAAIETSADDQTVTAPQSASFTVVADGDPSPSVRWQVSTDGGTTFNDLSENSTYSGVATSTLTVSATTAAMNANKLRAVATNGVGTSAA